MENPWNSIDISDYENHMKLNTIYQLQTLNKMMLEQINLYDISSLMILGIAGGNGLEHIEKSKIGKVYGVDINSNYLKICRERYPNLNKKLFTIQKDLTQATTKLPYADLVIANLLVEYIGYRAFITQIKIIKPHYISLVIQDGSKEELISISPYLNSLRELKKVHHTVNQVSISNALSEIAYQLQDTKEVKLPNGKKLIQLDFACN